MKNLKNIIGIVVLCLFSVFFNACNPVNRVDIERLLSPSALPYLKPSKLIQVSSYDTSGGNNDRISIAPGKKRLFLMLMGQE